MKKKRLFLAGAALLVASGLWFSLPARNPHDSPPRNSTTTADSKISSDGQSVGPGHTPDTRARLAPPDPTRRLRDFTPEQRVEFARKGHGPGG